MIERCYLEITSTCNLNCVFCPGTKRAARMLTAEEFDLLTDRLAGKVRFLYFHLMGEPLLHPLLPDFIVRAREKGLVPVLTTNGTLFGCGRIGLIVDSHPYKTNISLHSFEGNGGTDAARYVCSVMEYALQAARAGTIVILRLWNAGGYEEQNDAILSLVAEHAPRPWTARDDGFKLADNLYVEYDSMFSWPSGEASAISDEFFCHALRGQIGVLSDGSVVPCCLDHDGDLKLGNLFELPLEEILDCDRARAMFDGFSAHRAVEPLCQRCGYATARAFHSR